MSGAEQTVELTKPVVAHGVEISSITLREPTAEDIMAEGYPYIVVPAAGGGSGIQLQPGVVARYAVRLGKVPLSTVKALSAADLQHLQVVVMGFFGQTDQD
jgi:hypothetical protein